MGLRPHAPRGRAGHERRGRRRADRRGRSRARLGHGPAHLARLAEGRLVRHRRRAGRGVRHRGALPRRGRGALRHPRVRRRRGDRPRDRGVDRHPPGRITRPRAAPRGPVPHGRRPVPGRLRPAALGHPGGDGREHGPDRLVEPRHRSRCLPVGRLLPGRAPGRRPPQRRGLHAGHRIRRHGRHAQDVRGAAARSGAPERHPPGGPAERRGGARHAVLRRRLRLDGPAGERLRDRRGVHRGGLGQDRAGQGRCGRRRRHRRHLGGVRCRLRQHERHRRGGLHVRQGHLRTPLLPGQRPPRGAAPSSWPAPPWPRVWGCPSRA